MQVSDGNWYLGGVVNQRYPHKAAVEWMHYAYFDDRISEFHCETVGC